MSPFNLETCARPNILALQPYRCARDDYKDDGTNILLDANENAYGPPLEAAAGLDGGFVDAAAGDGAATAAGLSAEVLAGLHRYPDPHQGGLKQQLCALRNMHAHSARTLGPDNVFVGVGSDEAIDGLLRTFCVPGRDAVLVCPPTYGMYTVSAQVNDVALVRVPLRPAPGFGLDAAAVCAALAADARVKLVYLCSPGNPTGGLLAKRDVQRVLEHPAWNGVVVLDEAYVDFAADPAASLAEWVLEWPNLVVMQTLSKAFGMAGIRLGAAFAAPPVARLLNSLKAPYNVSTPASALAAYALSPPGLAAMRANRARILAQRARLLAALPAVAGVGRLRGGTDSNFLLFEMLDARGRPDNLTAKAVYQRLAEARGVVVRFRGTEHGCEGCLRITVGTEDEVTRLLAALKTTLAEVRGVAEEEEVASSRTEDEEKGGEVEANGFVVVA